MTTQSLVSLFIFALVSSITPGPNNLMLMASGTNFGFKRTLPHMLGVTAGVSFMILIIGFGVAEVMRLWPVSYTILKMVSVVYMLWLAFKIATASAPDQKNVSVKPITFFQAVLFQWVNPKAWSMALSAVTLYSPKAEIYNLLIVSFIFALVNLPSVSTWALLGQKIRIWLTSEKHLRIFNYAMAFLLILTLGFIF
jgi:threonine/homoserine/homoserine lactone efflux protein